LALTAYPQKYCFLFFPFGAKENFFFPSCASTVKAINPVRGQTTIKISNRKKEEKISIVKL